MAVTETPFGVRINYEYTGEGSPLLLVSGTGHDLTFWADTLPMLQKEYLCIRFDNRGVGKSSIPEPGYTLREMADDTRCVLDALGIEQAHVMGFSMGGHIAQEFALSYPDRLLSLGIHHSWARNDPRLAGFQRIRRRLAQLGEVEALADMSLFGIYGQDYYQRNLSKMQDRRTELIATLPTRLKGWEGQLHACLNGNTYDRLPAISVPTVITCSDGDMIVASHRSQEIHEQIAGSQFHMLRGTGHVALIEQPEKFAQVCLDFLSDL